MQIIFLLVFQLTSAEEFLVAAVRESHKKNKTSVLKPTKFNTLHYFFVHFNTALYTYAIFCKYSTSQL